ncbi:MAG: HK97 family phage prohead protease, partial [Alphaproteobacteria bacterium]
LWEVSIVTFPANPNARVRRVKMRPPGLPLPSEREFERFLMHDAGLSRSQARTVLGVGYKALVSRRDAGHDFSDLAARLRRVAALMAADAAIPSDSSFE